MYHEKRKESAGCYSISHLCKTRARGHMQLLSACSKYYTMGTLGWAYGESEIMYIHIDTKTHIYISYVLRARDILDFMNPRASDLYCPECSEGNTRMARGCIEIPSIRST